MPQVRILREKGATIEVVAAGEVLFPNGKPVHGWTRRFANRIKKFTAEEAPRNKRPRWAHYGEPLHKTIVSKDPRPRKVKNGMVMHAAVGSTAPYAYYVDQGTGIHGGNGPYEGKILPPFAHGSPTLYEHTWKVPRPSYVDRYGERVSEWEEVGTVTIKGQRGQHFFAKGLDRAFNSMMRRGWQKPAEASLGPALRSWVHGLDNFSGNTPWSFAFDAQLREWRAWRDAAFGSGKTRGLHHIGGVVAPGAIRQNSRTMRLNGEVLRARAEADVRRRAKNAERQKRWRDRHPDKVATYNKSRRKTTGKIAKDALSLAKAAAIREMKRYVRANPQNRIDGWGPEGFWVVDRRGERDLHYWPAYVADHFVNAGVQYKPAPRRRDH